MITVPTASLALCLFAAFLMGGFAWQYYISWCLKQEHLRRHFLSRILQDSDTRREVLEVLTADLGGSYVVASRDEVQRVHAFRQVMGSLTDDQLAAFFPDGAADGQSLTTWQMERFAEVLAPFTEERE